MCHSFKNNFFETFVFISSYKVDYFKCDEFRSERLFVLLILEYLPFRCPTLNLLMFNICWHLNVIWYAEKIFLRLMHAAFASVTAFCTFLSFDNVITKNREVKVLLIPGLKCCCCNHVAIKTVSISFVLFLLNINYVSYCQETRLLFLACSSLFWFAFSPTRISIARLALTSANVVVFWEWTIWEKIYLNFK